MCGPHAAKFCHMLPQRGQNFFIISSLAMSRHN
nr:unnamed protein product [Callosobruchus analis]